MYSGMGASWLDNLKQFGNNLLNAAVEKGGQSLMEKWGLATKPTETSPATTAPTTATSSTVTAAAKSTWPILAVVGGGVAALGAVIYLRRRR